MASEAGNGAVVIFDLGGVLIDWNPRHLYRTLFDDEDAMEWFLAEVCTGVWNAEQDAGRPFEDGVAELAGRYPEFRPLIEAYWRRWPEMVSGPIEGSVALLDELRGADCELHALTNWSAETFALTRPRFAFLEWFETILVSAEVGLIKPDPRIFARLVERIGRRPRECVYVDDSRPNVVMAEHMGFDTIHYRDPGQLRGALVERELLA